VQDAVDILKAARFDLIILETSGIGQSDTEIVDHSDVSLYVMTPEFGAATQLEKIDMLDFADIIAINKFDKRGALDALRDVKKQYQRNHQLWEMPFEDMPVFGTIASQFNDPGMNALYRKVMQQLAHTTGAPLRSAAPESKELSEKIYIIPPARTRYLAEIAENNRRYDAWAEHQAAIARRLFGIRQSIETIESQAIDNKEVILAGLRKAYSDLEKDLDGHCSRSLENWADKKAAYAADEYVFKVRDREIRTPTFSKSLSHTRIPRVALPKFKDWGEILRWTLQENVPGEFPYTAGVFPFKRKEEDPTRMFAGEGGPERTNRRFHYVSQGHARQPPQHGLRLGDAVRRRPRPPARHLRQNGQLRREHLLPRRRQKTLLRLRPLRSAKTSVSMTINGPAATICAFFMNAAIDQQCEKYIRENGLEHLVEAKLKEKYTMIAAVPANLPPLPRGGANCRRATTASACSCWASPAIEVLPRCV
jgi:methylmalonyl-CoA mutase